MQHRQHQGATVHDHPLPTEPGADKGYFLAGATIEPRDDHADHEDRDENDAGRKQVHNELVVHCGAIPVAG
ncbi:hypothetical protein [Devosia sp. Root413D1]|uniref:hypothetical protein n=1 Tax=Devosia sp. Root413D1 TaxID=1736531 RepID=UPI001910502A|nr:hypothetical protein [Devosia sp. Root413D1]